MKLFDDRAGRTNAAIKRVGVLNIEGGAVIAGGEIEFVVIGDALQQIPRPLKAKLRLFVQQEIGLVSAAQAVAKLDVGARPARMDIVVPIDTHQEPRSKQRNQRSRLYLILSILDEAGYLARRLSATSFDPGGLAVTKIGGVQLSNPVIGKTRALANGSRSRLVANHSQSEFELAAFAGITVIS